MAIRKAIARYWPQEVHKCAGCSSSRRSRASCWRSERALTGT